MPNSLSLSSEKPTENVLTGPLEWRAMSATIRLESRPPLSIAPSGTSAISRSRTDSSSCSSSPSMCSCALRCATTGSGYSQNRSTRRPSEPATSRWPGSSLDTPAIGVRGPEKKPNVR